MTAFLPERREYGLTCLATPKNSEEGYKNVLQYISALKNKNWIRLKYPGVPLPLPWWDSTDYRRLVVTMLSIIPVKGFFI